MLEDHRNMYRCKSLHFRANRWGQNSEEHLSKHQFLHVLRRVAYLLPPHRHGNICTVFLEIKLLVLFFQRNCRWRICIWTMMSISRSFTIFKRGKMPILISVIALTENEMKEVLCRITLISESYINNFAWLFCRERHELLLKCAQYVQHDYFLHAIVDCFVKFHCRCCSLTLSYTAHRVLTCFITV